MILDCTAFYAESGGQPWDIGLLADVPVVAVIEGVLDRWTPDMLTLEVRREYAGQVQVHSRASILQRIFSHEAYHCGELSQTLGIHSLPQIDLWTT